MKVIFLDIDGVLNGYSKWTDRVFGFADKVHLRRWLVRHYDIFGVRTYKVWLLKRIIERRTPKLCYLVLGEGNGILHMKIVDQE